VLTVPQLQDPDPFNVPPAVQDAPVPFNALAEIASTGLTSVVVQSFWQVAAVTTVAKQLVLPETV